ncbi:glycosyltransferase family 9 protein [Methylacidimicrobium sp. B4]|uniref:glycosyltransferase family 9 protein n=1 Tax=Methylacidimicrobium sp. B4 TaxID=2796139 RepID=UPI001A8D5CA0|nr:glycosyltransferase family 9 protein [Methylacidimicrobium sp. B4]QSR84385.1 glycosyltransferase family 9 protein [Methylacidimicrobium sp. B4]
MPWVSYADHFEDLLLHRSLEEVSGGFYVDLGPADPVKNSVTKPFSERGWRGVNVVADRSLFESFCAARPGDLTLLARFASEPGGGRSEEGLILEGKGGAFSGLDAVLAEAPPEAIHFLIAASRGWGDRLLRRFPFALAKPWIVLRRGSGSAEEPKAAVDGFLLSQGYALARSDDGGRFYLARERSEKRVRLAADPGAGDDFLPFRYAEEIEGLRRERAELLGLTRLLSGENERFHRARAANPLRRLERALRGVFRRKAGGEVGAPPILEASSADGGAPVSPPEGGTAAPAVGALEVHRLSGVGRYGDPMPEKPRILVLQLDHIGDFVTRLPAFRLLRSLWPEAQIDLICGPWNLPLAKQSGYFQRILPFAFFPEQSAQCRPDPSRVRQIGSEFGAVAGSLGDYDLAIDLRMGTETRGLLGLVPAKLRAGFAAPEADVFLDISLPDPRVFAPGEKNRQGLNWEISALLLVRAVEAALIPAAAAAKAERPGGPPAQRLVAVAPGSGSTARKWSVLHYAEVCRKLTQEHRCSILLLGGAGDREDADRIAQGIPSERCRNLVGKVALADLAGCLSEARVLVGNNSGVSHIAASLAGIPVVIPYAGTVDFRVFHPVGKKVSVLRVPTSCSLCALLRAEECPHALACLESIPPEAVIREVLFWLGEAEA